MNRATPYDYLIAGGGVAGVTAAEEIRVRDPHSTILIVSQEETPLYSRVLLPHYVRGKIVREKVFLRSFEQYAHARIDLWTDDEIIAVNYDNREATTKRGKVISYRKMLIATGGVPLAWPFEEKVTDYIFRLQTIDDADRLHKRLQSSQPGDKVLVVGGGFIALELIESAVAAGLEVHVFLRGEKLLGDVFDDVGWKMLLQRYTEHKVTIHSKTEIAEIKPLDTEVEMHSKSGEIIKGAWVGLGVGITRNFGAFEGGGVRIASGVVVNQYLETGESTVWAAGDVAEPYDVVFGEQRILGNWTNAVMQGKVVGINMASPESKKEFRTVSSYSITSLGNHITIVGRAELRSGMNDLVRVWHEEGGYERLFFEGDILRGAVLVNRFKDKPTLARLIDQGQPLGDKKAIFQDPHADIASII